MEAANYELQYETIMKHVVLEVLKQVPSELADLVKKGVYFEEMLMNGARVRVQGGKIWEIEVGKFVQGFKPRSFSLRYVVLQTDRFLWSGTVFMDPERVEEHTFQEYREMKLMHALNNLDIILHATLEADLTREAIEDYLKYQGGQAHPVTLEELKQLEPDFTFREFKGHRLSELFALEVEGILLYGFFQKIGQSVVVRASKEENYELYELYVGLRRGVMYPLGELPGVKGAFAQVRGHGAIWIRQIEAQSLLDQMIGAFESIEHIESLCFPGMTYEGPYQLEVVRQGKQVEVVRLTEAQDYASEVIEEVLTVVAKLQDLIHGEVALDQSAWESVVTLLEEQNLWFLLEYQGSQLFCDGLMREASKMVESLYTEWKVFSDSGLMRAYLKHKEELIVQELSHQTVGVIPHHYELDPTLEFKRLTTDKASEIMALMVIHLTEFYKIDYTDLTYIDDDLS